MHGCAGAPAVVVLSRRPFSVEAPASDSASRPGGRSPQGMPGLACVVFRLGRAAAPAAACVAGVYAVAKQDSWA
eukprot:11171184-Lingulodinium_polyedra.AAC.1